MTEQKGNTMMKKTFDMHLGPFRCKHQAYEHPSAKTAQGQQWKLYFDES